MADLAGQSDIVVVKVGSSTLVDAQGAVDRAFIADLCAQVVELRRRGKHGARPGERLEKRRQSEKRQKVADGFQRVSGPHVSQSLLPEGTARLPPAGGRAPACLLPGGAA